MCSSDLFLADFLFFLLPRRLEDDVMGISNFFYRCEIVWNVEADTDVFWSSALSDVVGDGLASEIKELFNVEKICGL